MKSSVSLLLTVFGFASIATVGHAGLTPGHWCGKPYGAIRHAPVSPTPDIDPNPPVINTTLPGFGIQYRYQPYLSTDTTGSLVVNVPAKGNYTIKAALADGTILLPATLVTATDLTQEIKNVNLTLVKPQLTAYYTTITFLSGAKIVQKSIVRLYRLPSGPKTVRVDRLYGGIIPANMENPIFPWFPYIDFGWIIGGKGMEANLKFLKAIGYNSINPDPTWTNVTQVDQMLEICEQLGIYVQISFRYDFTDTQTVISNVKRWMTSNAVLTWYSTDEPDGTQTNQNILLKHPAIRATDPYRPVSLVLNCQLSAGYYTDASDIYGTDVYPIGISTKGCNATTGDCGCDLCEGSLTEDIISRTNRYRSDYAAQGVQSIPVWIALQAFLDPGSWWKRSPTPEEFTVMFWLSIIEGYKAIGFWQYPYLPKYKPLHEVLSTQLNAVGPSQILTSTQLPASHITIKGTGAHSTLFAGAWFSTGGSSLLFIVVNANPVLTTFTVAATDAKAISGNGKEVASGTAVTVENGAVSGKLEALSAGVYTFHLESKAASSKNSA
ncbi:hypothetical protein BC937DRAFT_88201 [Endogone sp. FLAS-F59071]|nr:hypothetical protein BC937DRAFT_88201 [Endogone sp. FLAS-F59071]|eukprot:RUS18897.1 hypothetical protein BC937DRAFT_88201 [Endogone sp. FLAS-F59071]